jgi:hypothetical protein
VRAGDDSAGCTCRLNRRFHHDAQKLNGVVRDAEPFAEAQRRFPEALPFLLQLLHSRLQLLGHLVEGGRKAGELVVPAHRHALLQVTVRNRPRRLSKLAHTAHDHLSLEEGDRAHQEEESKQPEKDA